jgi:GT2 family glycosyltransferase
MSEIRLSIVFLNFNRIEETRFTVEQLCNLVADRPDIEVIAVDNGSDDGTGDYLLTQQNFLRPVLLAKNGGIAGYNRGFELARGDYLLILDDDSHPMDEASLDHLIARFDSHPKVGAIACAIFDREGQTVSSWHLPDDLEAGPSMSFIGCGFAIRRDLFASCGWYPAEFFLYQNEIEVAMQVRIRGFSVEYMPECRVQHRIATGNRGGWRQVFFATRNSLWLIRQHYQGPQLYYLLLSRCCISLVRAVQLKQLSAYAQGLRQGLFSPVTRDPLPAHLFKDFLPFWKQNSLWHHLLNRT